MSQHGPHLYFVRNATTDAVKIGSTNNVTRRVRELEFAAGAPLELLLAVKSGGDLEYRLHRAFDDDRLLGEWFGRSARMDQLIRKASVARIPAQTICEFLGDESILAARRRRGDAQRKIARDTRKAARVALGKSDWWRPFVTPDGVTDGN